MPFVFAVYAVRNPADLTILDVLMFATVGVIVHLVLLGDTDNDGWKLLANSAANLRLFCSCGVLRCSCKSVSSVCLVVNWVTSAGKRKVWAGESVSPFGVED